MDNVKFVEIENPITEMVTVFAVIDRGNNEFTTMTKAYYDEQQKAAELGGTL